MSIAVVFDSAGTLLKTNRSVIQIKDHTFLPDSIETTTLTFDDADRILVLINISSAEVLDAPPEMTLSAYMKEHAITFGISCGRKIIDADAVGRILEYDTGCKMADVQAAVSVCKENASREFGLFALNAGIIVNTRCGKIEFAIASAGHPFPGVRRLISSLHKKGVAVFIASGDRTEKLELVADKIGIPRNRVHGVATPVTKAQVVRSLKAEYDVVLMVGDGINDLSAMREADVSVLTVQQGGDKLDILRTTADYIISDIGEVEGIIEGLGRG
ncbi:MAG TPA: HAD-IC family P-type ATPase [Methanocorpusculum sp.]|nr:HAD-IC family P-type ATPase [Methanocorpusculum sp.]